MWLLLRRRRLRRLRLGRGFCFRDGHHNARLHRHFVSQLPSDAAWHNLPGGSRVWIATMPEYHFAWQPERCDRAKRLDW